MCPVVSGSSPDHPAGGEHPEGFAAVLVSAARAGQRGRPQLHPGHPDVSAGPEDRGEGTLTVRVT